MKRILIAAALALSLTGCTQDQVLIASAVANGGCLLANTVTGAGITATEINLPADADPAASKTLARWKAGQAVSAVACAQIAAALQSVGQQVVALKVTK